MSLRITPRQDFSYLFFGMNKKAANNGLNNFLNDYASIKNGSYGKLMRAYYAENRKDEISSIGKDKTNGLVSGEEAKVLTRVQSTSDALKDSADALLATGSKSVFEKEDKTGLYSAVKHFVEDYNSVVKAVGDSGTRSVVSRGENMIRNTAVYGKSLSRIGITLQEDNTLKLDQEALEKADISKVKSLFQGNGSFGYQTSAQAALINYGADAAASRNATYGASGQYVNMDAGNLFNSYF